MQVISFHFGYVIKFKSDRERRVIIEELQKMEDGVLHYMSTAADIPIVTIRAGLKRYKKVIPRNTKIHCSQVIDIDDAEELDEKHDITYWSQLQKAAVVKFLKEELNNEGRLEIFNGFCLHCGCVQPEIEMHCQCSNDE